MEDAKYCGRDWIPTGNWPQAQYKPSNDRTTPGDFAQVLRCGSSHLNFGTSIPSNFLHTSLLHLGIFHGFYNVLE